MLNHHSALLLIDIQNDFCSGGSLSVPHGDDVVPVANQLMPYFDHVIASQDWHPQGHVSFASSHPSHQIGDVISIGEIQQTLWPDHCIQNSWGASFHQLLNQSFITKIIQKGIDRHIDSYSAFYDNRHLQSTGLSQWLRNNKITTLYVMGLATDYCVKFSCIDALDEKFTVNLVLDGCRGVNLHANDVQNTLQILEKRGVKLIQSTDIIRKS